MFIEDNIMHVSKNNVSGLMDNNKIPLCRERVTGTSGNGQKFKLSKKNAQF